jgi:hypothetical protein
VVTRSKAPFRFQRLRWLDAAPAMMRHPDFASLEVEADRVV